MACRRYLYLGEAGLTGLPPGVPLPGPPFCFFVNPEMSLNYPGVQKNPGFT